METQIPSPVPLFRFQPWHFRGGKIARNRVVVPPMASQTATNSGIATEATIAHYARLAQACAGILMVEYTFVHATGRSESNQLGISSDQHIAGLTAIAGEIKKSGALAGIQLSHGGAKSSVDLTGGTLCGPSAIAVPSRDSTFDVPSEISTEGIDVWRSAFLSAVDRAVIAGFELVEFHSAHGYGLNQWLSPLTNRRTDEYGGGLAARSRLLREIITSARARYPHLVLSARIPGQDFLEGGLTTTDIIELVHLLEDAGLDIVDVSSGLGGWRRPRDRQGEGYLVAEARQIKAATSLPVIGVGGIKTGTFIDELLASGSVSFAAVGREILENPLEWAQNQMHCRRH